MLLLWDLISSAQGHSQAAGPAGHSSLAPRFEWWCNTCASLKGLGKKVENTEFPFRSYFIQTICIASFSWVFFFCPPREIFPWLGAGSWGSSWFCWGVAAGLPSGRGSSAQRCGSRAALPASSAAKFAPCAPSGRELPRLGKKKKKRVKNDQNRQYCACRAKPSAAAEEPPGSTVAFVRAPSPRGACLPPLSQASL